jgi:predicted AAA+ superfamily ATPase
MKNIILGHKLERDELLRQKYIPRDGLQRAQESLKNNLIKVITGPRRAGKSVFALQMLKGIDFAYVNFDDERLIRVSDYDEIMKAILQIYGETHHLLFDEIQNLTNWELIVNRLHRRGLHIVITGSNSRLLSRELATHLTGRYTQFQILPFSFLEFLRARNFIIDETISLKEKQGLLLNHLNDYLNKGGFPEIVTKNVDCASYSTTLFESILFKDIVKRYNVRYSKMLYDLGLYLITNHSNTFSYTRLKNALGFRSVHTVENYIEYLQEAFLVFNVERFSTKVREQLKSPKKTYAYDTGTIHAVKFKMSPDTGRLIENAVAVELLRRGKEFYYYKTRDGKEVDFAIKEGLKIEQLIQVCYGVDHYETKKRELNALVRACPKFFEH